MNKLIYFDALVVYTETLAVSASDTSIENIYPFPIGSRSEAYNNVYGYFLEVCKRNRMRVAFTTSADIEGAGRCKSFWTYQNKQWKKNNTACFSELIFEKFSPVRKGIKRRRELLFSSDEVKSFNDPELFDLFLDKQKTYDRLSEHAIPTVSIEGNSLENITMACAKLEKMVIVHQGLDDFKREIVMKDRFGAGGRHIYKFKMGQSEKMLKVIKRHKRVSFIIQPFAKFDFGFSLDDRFASADIRLIYINGEIVQYYVRIAKEGDYRCNEHQGGSLTYLKIKDISSRLVEKAKKIADELEKKSFYALDFIISNNGNPYLLEGNAGPGLDWNESLKNNETQAKKLICLIVAELANRSADQKKRQTDLLVRSVLADDLSIGFPVLT